MTSTAAREREGMFHREAFLEMSGRYDLIPLVQEMKSGGRTPLSLYRRLKAGRERSFLLESGAGDGVEGRYSFIGVEPERIFLAGAGGCRVLDGYGHPLNGEPRGRSLREALEGYLSCRRPALEGLPPFAGGVAGYWGYGMVEEWETLFHESGRTLMPGDLPRAVLMGFPTVVAMDHRLERIQLIHNVAVPDGATGEEREGCYRRGRARLEDLARRLDEPTGESPGGPFSLGGMEPHMPKETFLEMVRRGKEHILAGEVCQVVLSQAFSAETDLPSLHIYEALKAGNPSPYLFVLDLPECELLGSSPEVLVKVEGGRVTTRPLAGTRRRGGSPAENEALAAELLADEKERAEHLMLVDLARNDLGRVCGTGSVHVTELMGVEHYSQVMHIVSQVEGTRLPALSALDVLASTFPAGTVSGAPKIRAMELIEELEGVPRGPYAGAVGYVGFDGNLDSCITIRTILRRGNRVTVQAGAGIVYDSVPEREYEETRSKAGALFAALEAAGKGCGLQ
ncbi:MAG: chorismate-binding protein [Synergistales bacterium]|nr:chorismate-binding protein [Synergistales bacterium]